MILECVALIGYVDNWLIQSGRKWCIMVSKWESVGSLYFVSKSTSQTLL